MTLLRNKLKNQLLEPQLQWSHLDVCSNFYFTGELCLEKIVLKEKVIKY